MSGRWKLHLRMWLASIIMFVLLYIICTVIGRFLGFRTGPMFYLVITLFITFYIKRSKTSIIVRPRVPGDSIL